VVILEIKPENACFSMLLLMEIIVNIMFASYFIIKKGMIYKNQKKSLYSLFKLFFFLADINESLNLRSFPLN